MNLKRAAVITTCIVIAAWIVTLGFFRERSFESECSIAGKDPWPLFSNGDIRTYPNMWIDIDHDEEFGIPYTYFSICDRPPYSLSCAFWIMSDDRSETLLIDDIELGYADGSVEKVAIPPECKRVELTFDADPRTPGDISCRGANFRLAGVILKRQALKVTIAGRLEGKTSREPYRQTVDIAIRDRSYYYPGWIALFLRSM